MLTLDVGCFALAMAFLDANAILPLLMERLGATGAFIGIAAGLRFLASNAFQIVVAHRLHSGRRQKPFLVLAVILGRAPLVVLPWLVWRASTSPLARWQALWGLIGLLTLWSLFDGLGYVPWMEIVARVFGGRTRGRFFATTQVLSGVLTFAAAGLVVRPVLGALHIPFPHDYAVLTALAFLMFAASTLGVLLIREPEPPTQVATPPFRTYVSRIPAMVRANPLFVRLAVVQLLIGFGAAASPFYVIHAVSHFRLADVWAGNYQAVQATGVVALTPAWAWVSENRGPAAAVKLVACLCCCTPVIALTLGAWNPWMFALVFLLMGGSLGWGTWVAVSHLLLTHVTDEDRPMYVALLNLLFAPSAAYPYLGGLMLRGHNLIRVFHVPMLFLVTALVTGAGALLAIDLPRPDRDC